MKSKGISSYIHVTQNDTRCWAMEGTLKVDAVQEGWQAHKHAIFSHAESIRTVPETRWHRSLRWAQGKEETCGNGIPVCSCLQAGSRVQVRLMTGVVGEGQSYTEGTVKRQHSKHGTPIAV